ncbi:SAM dependent carboxyl methyltransferase [Nitzschia inconspicua]|uniref:SAM dependent carboxyl methyltransferase n=1 Tax=Nitzschia inconspicua TaxID=303405 RepID=A0A9K3Q4N9_9STRA|nr:SAM dependent carboxyl methyltransferase [Nitzschia inconspicua]
MGSSAAVETTTADFERHSPVGKDGEGLYSASTKGCFDVIDTATPYVMQAIENIPSAKDSSNLFTVADFGTADGGTSLGLMAKIVQAVRQQSGNADREIHIHYEDQRENEWKSVFNHALGITQVTDAHGKILPVLRPDASSGVFVSACGIGFHEQAFPSNSIDLGLSFTAMHWLSQAPSSLVGRPAMHASQSPTPPAAERLQAAQDWKRILQARAKELRPGGRLVIANFCKSKEGYFLGNTDVGANMWESFQICWDQLAKEGLIDEEERLAVSFPNYYRSSQECIDGVDKVDELKVIECFEKIVRCPYREAWNNGNVESRTAREQAAWFVPTTRTWSESTFKNALKPHQNKNAIMERFWSNYVDLVTEDPSKHGMDYVHTYLVIEKSLRK